tara:strand:+ start:185 stop:1384 length:1200 start_codon:yes stop_codon:yes gene_type:complete
MILPGLLLFIVSYITFKFTSKKILSLRISNKFLGHYTIEPAMLSSVIESENINTIISIKRGRGINNQGLKNVINKVFNLSPDYFLSIIEHIYNWSPLFISKVINNYYSPFLEKKNLCREISYITYLDTRLAFPWRQEVRSELNINRAEKKNILIALRTSHFHMNSFTVSDQEYRNISKDDLQKVIDSCLDIEKIQIYCYCDKNLSMNLRKKNTYPKRLVFIDQDKTDILNLLNQDTLLINNGNGISAASLSLGVKTLYIQHTLCQFWHTSHTNGFTIPTEYYSDSYGEDIDSLMKMIFSTPDMVPYDFNRNYMNRNIKVKPIKLLSNRIISSTVKDALNYEAISDERKIAEYLGCQFLYASDLEKYFWEKYIYYLPIDLRKCHQNITLQVSKTYLDNLI